MTHSGRLVRDLSPCGTGKPAVDDLATGFPVPDFGPYARIGSIVRSFPEMPIGNSSLLVRIKRTASFIIGGDPRRPVAGSLVALPPASEGSTLSQIPLSLPSIIRA
jgi:hypothetical protein